MKKFKIYHNSQCSKSRATLKLLEDANVEIEIISYLENPPSPSELDLLLNLLRVEPQQIVRQGEDLYEELHLHTQPPKHRKEWIDVLVNNPILIERPIVSDGKNAVIGRPPEKVKILLRNNAKN